MQVPVDFHHRSTSTLKAATLHLAAYNAEQLFHSELESLLVLFFKHKLTVSFWQKNSFSSTDENTASLTLEIELTAFGETIDYPVPPALANVCNHLDGRGCPITAGERIVHASGIPVIVDFGGGVPVTLRSRIYNASGSVLSCSVINARIY